jgi:hypothetical protein
MVGVPRSQRLIYVHATTGGYFTPFVCPTGYVTLVKSAYMLNSSAAALDFILIVQAAGQSYGQIIVSETLQSLTEFAWQGWIVLNPSDLVGGSISGADGHFWLSGAVLAGAPQFPPASGMWTGDIQDGGYLNATQPIS